MRLSLLHNELLPENGRQTWRPLASPNIFQNLRENYPKFDYLIVPLERVMRAKIEERASDEKIDKQISLIIVPNPTSPDPERITRCVIQFKNYMLGTLHEMFYKNAGIIGHLKLVLTVKNPENGLTGEVIDFKPRSLRTPRGRLEDHNMYMHFEAMFPKDIFSKMGIYVSVAVDIDNVDIPSCYPYDRKLPLPVAENEKIFNDKSVPRDVIIITMEGCKVPCHWFHLVNHSKVFLSMLTFTAELNKNKQYELELKGMSEKAVNVLLEYIYLGKLTEAENDPKIAMELLDAAELYKIETLFEAMKKMFKDKTDDWIGLEVTVKLYKFAKHFPELADLFRRADYILWSKRREVLEEYFQNNEDLFGKEFCKQLVLTLFGCKDGSKRVKLEPEQDAVDNDTNDNDTN